jgi:hypothetical protein
MLPPTAHDHARTASRTERYATTAEIAMKNFSHLLRKQAMMRATRVTPQRMLTKIDVRVPGFTITQSEQAAS